MRKRIISFALVIVAIVLSFSISVSAYTLGVNTWKYGNLVNTDGTPGCTDTIYLNKGKTYTIQVGINLSANKYSMKELTSFAKDCYFTVNIYTDTNKYIKSYTNIKVGQKFTLPTSVKKYRVDIIKHFPGYYRLGSNFAKNNCHYIGYCVVKV